jgi:cytosine/adenosine deaminase-related metal-dependent hydrolase
MSSLIFYTDPAQALIATDTLAVKPDGQPLMFCSKAVYIPHLRTIVAGTGLGGFANDWANEVNNRLIVGGLRNLDHHTPDSLRKRWAEATSSPDFPSGLTTTVYQIGIGEDDEDICAFAYRSTNDFASEPLGHGTRAKPDCTFPKSGNFVKDVQAMMLEQRAIQSALPHGQRLYIGGECIIMHLTKDTFTATSVFRFEDYEEQLDQIFSAF